MPLLRRPGLSAASLRGIWGAGRPGEQALCVRQLSRLRFLCAAHRTSQLPMGTLADKQLRAGAAGPLMPYSISYGKAA